ncbi:hypothetical protein WJX82_009654 [Trebouxia sp. C0006]
MAEGPGITSVSDGQSSLPFKKKGDAHPPARADEAPAIRDQLKLGLQCADKGAAVGAQDGSEASECKQGSCEQG